MWILNSLITLLCLLIASCGSPTVAGSEAGNSKIGITVILPSGVPVANERINIFQTGDSILRATAVTNSSGFAEFSNLPRGSYQILSAKSDSILFRTVTLSDVPIAVVDTLKKSQSVRFSQIPIPATMIRLAGTPIERPIVLNGTDSIAVVSGFPEGTFTVEIVHNSVSMKSMSPITFSSESSVNLDTIEWEIALSPLFGSVEGGSLIDNSLLIWTATYVQLFSDSSAVSYRIGTDLSGSKFTSVAASKEMLYMASDKEILLIRRSGERKRFAITETSRIEVMPSGFGVATSFYAGVSLFRGFDSTGLEGAQLPSQSYSITSFTADSDSSLYMGTNLRGVVRWIKGDTLTIDTSFVGARSLMINDIHYSAGTLWIATSSSLKSLSEGTWNTHYEGVAFSRIAQDSSGGIWCAVKSGGIYRFAEGGKPVEQFQSDPILELSTNRSFLFGVTKSGGVLKPL